MHIDATQPWRVEYALRQDQSVGGDHHQIGLPFGQLELRIGILQRRGLADRDVVLQRQLLDRAGLQLAPASGRAIRLRVNRDDFVIALQECAQALGGEIRRTGENDA